MPESFADDGRSSPTQQALGPAYEVRGLLGQGGFGVVYAAFDLSLKREVAVKVLRPEYAGEPAVRERFRREAEAAARLRHPHVMPIYGVGGDADLAYFIMPRATGESLTAHLRRRGPLPLPEVRRILGEAVSAVAAAHRAGIVHRDIKPDNILLDGDESTVLLTDFGIAKAAGAHSAVTSLTQTGVIMGSVHYMSPEQASGDGRLDHRTDIYSLGVVAYEMLTGELPFSGPTFASILVKHLSEAAPPVTRGRPDCPADLAAVVACCLAKEPEQRWAGAPELLQALEEGAAGTTPVRARVSQQVLMPVRRFRRLLGVAVIVVGVLLAVDVVIGRVLLSPVAALIAAGVIASHYGRLWTDGYSWANLLGKTRKSALGDTPDSSEYGRYAEVLRQARSQRAAMLTVLESVPKAARAPLRDVIPTADLLIARADELARQIADIERQMEPGLEELSRRAEMVRVESPSPSRNQRLGVLERRREAVQRLMASQGRLNEDLNATLAEILKVQKHLEETANA